jgi:predicted Zn-dependent protease
MSFQRALVAVPLLALCLMSLSSCATNPVTGRPNLAFMSEADEIRIGQQMHPQVLQQYGAYDDPKIQAYVNEIGQRLVVKSHRSNLKYTFTVLDSDEVNAFATPGGYIYITRGIMAYLNSEAELAAVIGHEIGHVAARHAVRQQSQSSIAGVGAIAVGILTGSGDLANLTGEAATALVRGYGRDMELEADRLGAENITAIGFSSENMVDVVRLLKNQEMFEVDRARREGRQPKIYHGVFATHPDNDTRLREVVQSAQKYATTQAGDDLAQGYLKNIEGLAVGSSRAQGVVRGTRFYHANLGFTLAFPTGWTVQNQADKLTALSPQRDSMIQMTTEAPPPNTGPREFLSRLLANAGSGQGEELEINGLRAYSAVVRSAKTPFGQSPVRYVVVFYNNLAYVFAGASKASTSVPSADPVILSSIKTFRRLRENELALAEPYKIKLVKATDATRVADLAKGSPLEKYPVESLRLYNDLYPNKEPRPGQLVKIVQ